jgi:hypothetical protein
VKVTVIALISVFAVCAQPGKEFAQTHIPYAPKSYVCYRCSQPLDIDGKIKENAWQKAPWTDYFQDIEGALKPEPTYRTRVKMLWDDCYFYFAAELEEPHVWATLTQRDAVIYYDNDFEIFIDPDGDTHEYYEYEVNAFGTEWDLLLTKPYRDGGCAIDGYNMTGLQTGIDIQGTINNPEDLDSGWTVEVAIPWESLKDCAHMPLPPNLGDQWRVNFSRVEWQMEIINDTYIKRTYPQTGKTYPENNWVWSPQGLIAMHAPETWGFVQFSKTIVGNGITDFKRNDADEARWALRRLYYNQRSYQINHGSFTEDFDQLALSNVVLQYYSWPPEIKITPSLFEAILQAKDGRKKWHITQDGKIWKTIIK